MTIAAGRFKQTQIAAYGEAIINIVLVNYISDSFWANRCCSRNAYSGNF